MYVATPAYARSRGIESARRGDQEETEEKTLDLAADVPLLLCGSSAPAEMGTAAATAAKLLEELLPTSAARLLLMLEELLEAATAAAKVGPAGLEKDRLSATAEGIAAAGTKG